MERTKNYECSRNLVQESMRKAQEINGESSGNTHSALYNLNMLRVHAAIGIWEKRLIGKGDFEQFARDIHTHHIAGRIKARDPISTAGAFVLPPLVALSTGFGAAVRSVTSAQPPVTLGNGGSKYTEQGLNMLAQDVGSFASHTFSLQLGEALGDAVNIAVDIPDLVTRPVLDVTSDAFGHVSQAA